MNSWRSLGNPVTHGTQADKKHTDKVRYRLASLQDRQQKHQLSQFYDTSFVGKSIQYFLKEHKRSEKSKYDGAEQCQARQPYRGLAGSK